MLAEINALIAKTTDDLRFHQERRDRIGMAGDNREREGVEALAARIRLKALQECRAIAERSIIKPGLGPEFEGRRGL